MATYIALAATMRQRQMRITMYCVALLLDIVNRNETLVFVSKNQASKVGLFLLSLNLNCFVRSGRGRASVVVVCWAWLFCCERGERRRWRERSEQRKNNVSIELARVLPSYVGQGLLNCDDRLPTITSLVSWRLCVSEPKRRHWRASVGSADLIFF